MEDILDQLKRIVPLSEKDYFSDDDCPEDLSFSSSHNESLKTHTLNMQAITSRDIVHSLSSPYVKTPQFYKNDIEFGENDLEHLPQNKPHKKFNDLADTIYQSIPLKTPLGSTIITKFKMMHTIVKEYEIATKIELKETQRTSVVKSIQSRKEKKEDTSFNKKNRPISVSKKANQNLKSNDLSRSISIRRNSSSTLNKFGFSAVEGAVDTQNSVFVKKTTQLLGQMADRKEFRKLYPFYIRPAPVSKSDILELHTEPLFTLIENVEKATLINKLG